ncbi:MAG: hypothetical protein ACTSRS_11330 [Candidatus Helarchaeota archaeon]
MRIPFLSKLNDKINSIVCDLNALGNDLVGILDEANANISQSLSKSTEDIKYTTDHIVASANTMRDSLQQTSEHISLSAEAMVDALSETTQNIKETAKNIAESAETIANAVENFTSSTSKTITQFENAIERAVSSLVSTINDFKTEMIQSGIKVNIARSASSLMPRPPEGGIVQGITSGIRDIIIPKRKPKKEKE